MSENQDQQRYGVYARQRLIRILLDLVSSTKGLSWTGLADRISEQRKVKFQRQNFYRLRAGELGDENINYIVEYLEAEHDSGIRERLHPSAIFDELAQPARDYYFHIPEPNDMDDWNEQILDEFSGVYFCEPATEVNSFMPTTYLRKWLREGNKQNKTGEIEEGKLNVFLQQRMVLILQKTPYGYFYAAELPLSALANSSLKSSCQRVLYEGIGIISSNTIQIKLRDCLTRVAKTHSIAVVNKYQRSYELPHGLSFHVFHNQKDVIASWNELSPGDILSLKEEQKLAIEAEYFMQGPVSNPTPPIPNRRAYISMVTANEYVYFKKPQDFLNNLGQHFVLSELSDEITIRKVVENPLVIGTMYGY